MDLEAGDGRERRQPDGPPVGGPSELRVREKQLTEGGPHLTKPADPFLDRGMS